MQPWPAYAKVDLLGGFGNAEMHQRAQTAGQPVAYLAQRIGMAQLAEQHGHELGLAIKSPGRTLSLVPLDKARKFQTRKMMQQLIEQTRDLYHHGRPGKRFFSDFSTKSFRYTAEGGQPTRNAKAYFGQE